MAPGPGLLPAAVWNGGISFGGAVSFIFADLIVIPILLIYRKYYGTAAALRITGILCLAMVLAGYAIEVIFGGLGLVPGEPTGGGLSLELHQPAQYGLPGAHAVLLVRFVRTGGFSMLREMSAMPPDQDTPGRQGHHH